MRSMLKSVALTLTVALVAMGSVATVAGCGKKKPAETPAASAPAPTPAVPQAKSGGGPVAAPTPQSGVSR